MPRAAGPPTGRSPFLGSPCGEIRCAKCFLRTDGTGLCPASRWWKRREKPRFTEGLSAWAAAPAPQRLSAGAPMADSRGATAAASESAAGAAAARCGAASRNSSTLRSGWSARGASARARDTRDSDTARSSPADIASSRLAVREGSRRNRKNAAETPVQQETPRKTGRIVRRRA